MRAPRSYIVRIYRRGFRTLSGVIEDTRTNTQQPFGDIDELIAVMRTPDSRAPPPGRREKVRSTK
ncbi:MAG: hypothetical protein HY067_20600 [Betaproteobacteria bacterium]|nr:hypothetical protein [Betaproteobacteria bacterium]